jgi:hypothetical protein
MILLERKWGMPSAVKNSLLWVFEPLEDDSGYFRKRLFGFAAAYVDGLLCLAVGVGEEPWNGLLVCTSQERHPAITNDFPDLAAHPVIGKWLYLSQTVESFEATATQLVRLVLERDPRFGVEPRAPKKPALKMKSGRKE